MAVGGGATARESTTARESGLLLILIFMAGFHNKLVCTVFKRGGHGLPLGVLYILCVSVWVCLFFFKNTPAFWLRRVPFGAGEPSIIKSTLVFFGFVLFS